MRRIALAVLVTSVFATSVARASDLNSADKASKDAAVDTTTASDPAAAPAGADVTVLPPAGQVAPAVRVNFVQEPSRPAVLPALYGGFVALQAYDVYSTQKALNAGAREANPHLAAVVNNTPMFIGLKAVVTAGSIFAAERMWRDHHRVGAIALMAAANGIMAAVAAHNSQVLATQR